MKISFDEIEFDEIEFDPQSTVTFEWDDGRVMRLYFRERGDEVMLEVMKTRGKKGAATGALMILPVSGNVIYVG